MKITYDEHGRVTCIEVTVPYGEPGFDADCDLVFDAAIGDLESLSKLPGFEPSGKPDPVGELLDGDGNVIASGPGDTLVDALIAALPGEIRGSLRSASVRMSEAPNDR